MKSQTRDYVNKFVELHKNQNTDIIEIHNRPNYVEFLKSLNSKKVLYFHNDPISMIGSKSALERKELIRSCAKIIFNSEWTKKRFLLNQNINDNINTIPKIKEILDNLIKNGKNVDWLEPMVGLYMNILQVKTEITEDENNLLEEYNKFLVYYENHKNDTEYLLNNFSNIINKINTLQ